MGFVKQLTKAGLMLLMVAPVMAADSALYADRSGSMAPYYETNLISGLCGKITEAVRVQTKSSPQLFAFSTNTQPVKTIEALTGVPLGADTYLNRALSDAINRKFGIVWIITDNLEDEQGLPEGEGTAVFYGLLKSPAVRKVTIFPIVRTQGGTAIQEGKSGIVVYGLLLGADAEVEFDREIKDLAVSLKKTYNAECFMMKPLGEKTVDSAIVNSSFSEKQKPYREGDPVRGSMEVRFKSNFQHLKITEATVEPDMSYGFGPDTLFTFEQPSVKITPEKLNDLGPGEATVQAYRVSVDIGKIRIKHDPVSILKAAFGQFGEDGKLNFSFLVKVNRDKLVFRDDFLKTYNATTPDEARQAGKVYALNQLPSLLAEDVTPIRVESPQRFRVTYPWWPAPLVFLVALVGLAGAGVGARQIARSIRGMLGKKARWEVEVKEPEPAKGIVEGSKVKVPIGKRVVAIGTIKDGSLAPASVVKPQGAQPIIDGRPITLSYNDTAVVVVFRRTRPAREPVKRRVNKNGAIKV